MMITEDILRHLSNKIHRLRSMDLEPKGLLLSNEDYDTLKEEFVKKGIKANPDRLLGLPLYTPDPDKVSIRTGQPKEPMVIF